MAEIHAGLFQTPQAVEVTSPVGWRFFARCDRDELRSCHLFRDAQQYDEDNRKAFRLLWRMLFEIAPRGVPWNQAFQDGQLFHSVHSFTVRRKLPNGKQVDRQVEVFQFKKKATKVRVLWVHGEARLTAFITGAFEKTTGETPRSEQNRAEAAAKEFFDALDSGRVFMISRQGGKPAADKIFY